RYSWQKVLDNLLDEAIEKLPKKSALRNLGALGQAPDLVDTVFDMLYLHQDREQRKNLDTQRDKALEAVNYWSRRARGENVSQQSISQQRGEAGSNFLANMQRLGVRVTTPAQAMREGLAKIAARARNGFELADVQVVSRSADVLALDFS